MLQHAQRVVRRDLAHFDRIESPFFEDAEDFIFAAFLRHQQHALLRFAEHDLVRSHAGFALRHAVEFDFNAHAAASAHLASGARQSGRAHILNADNRAGLHGFEAGFEQKFFEERIADLHIRPLRLRSLAEFLAGHGGAVNAVASGLGAHVDHRIAFARGLRVERFHSSAPGPGQTRSPADCPSSRARTWFRRRGWALRNSFRRKRRR